MGAYQISVKKGNTYRGSQYSISLSSVALSTLVPVDLTGASILMQVKHKPTDDDAVIEFSTSTSTITISAPSLSGIFYTQPRIIDVCADKYVYDVQITLNTGRVITPISDNFLVSQDVSR